MVNHWIGYIVKRKKRDPEERSGAALSTPPFSWASTTQTVTAKKNLCNRHVYARRVEIKAKVKKKNEKYQLVSTKVYRSVMMLTCGLSYWGNWGRRMSLA